MSYQLMAKIVMLAATNGRLAGIAGFAFRRIEEQAEGNSAVVTATDLLSLGAIALTGATLWRLDPAFQGGRPALPAARSQSARAGLRDAGGRDRFSRAFVRTGKQVSVFAQARLSMA